MTFQHPVQGQRSSLRHAEINVHYTDGTRSDIRAQNVLVEAQQSVGVKKCVSHQEQDKLATGVNQTRKPFLCDTFTMTFDIVQFAIFYIDKLKEYY